MLRLSGKIICSQVLESDQPKTLLKIETRSNLPAVLKKNLAFLVSDENIPSGFLHYIFFEKNQHMSTLLPLQSSYSVLGDEYNYLGMGDIIRLSSDKNKIRVLFRNSSAFNSILMTEQCNNYCLMCSQPPKTADDSWLLDEIEELIPLIPKHTKEIGFTGGEPTTNQDRFLKILNLTKNHLPQSAIHILSNGRSFKDFLFAQRYAAIQFPDAMVGIPLYSDDPALHDYIVQAQGAFDETIQGILNLKRLNQKVEIRIVLHALSVPRLKALADFIVRNLLFVDHIALMGLEMMGFTRANLEELWIDPLEYKDTLSEAVHILKSYNLNISVYNHQLCLINPDILPYYRKSISDWKNEYAVECEGCTKKFQCGGFFSSGIKYGYSKNVRPII